MIEGRQDVVLFVWSGSHIMGIIILMLQLWVSYTVSIMRMVMTVMLMWVVILVWSLIGGVDLILLTVDVFVM